MPIASPLSIPQPWFQKQRAMMQVSLALSPLVLAALHLFGWRTLALLAVVLAAGVITEALFVFPRNKPVTSAVLVTCLIFSLSLPPTLPLWMAVVGIVAAVALGKMAFGGFGRNVFNPAMVGRCFLYVTFPLEMTNMWAEPFGGTWGGMLSWTPPVDATTGATPLAALKKGGTEPLYHLLFGNTSGSMGETSALLILLGGAYILYTKAAPWRIALACLLGGCVANMVMQFAGLPAATPLLASLLSGSFLFGALFVATEPISGAKTKPGQWIYGFLIGAIIILLRSYSHFAEGVMFSVLLMNGAVPLLDQIVRNLQAKKKEAPA